MIGRVHASAARIDLLRELFSIGRAQLGQRAVVQDQLRQFVVGGQLFENVFGSRWLAGGRLAQHRYLQLFEQDLLQLLR